VGQEVVFEGEHGEARVLSITFGQPSAFSIPREAGDAARQHGELGARGRLHPGTRAPTRLKGHL
jgi:hypothetical protein